MREMMHYVLLFVVVGVGCSPGGGCCCCCLHIVALIAARLRRSQKTKREEAGDRPWKSLPFAHHAEHVGDAQATPLAFLMRCVHAMRAQFLPVSAAPGTRRRNGNAAWPAGRGRGNSKRRWRLACMAFKALISGGALHASQELNCCGPPRRKRIGLGNPRGCCTSARIGDRVPQEADPIRKIPF